MSEKINVAQFGTKHGHAQGVLEVMNSHPEVNVVGIWEPDKNRKEYLLRSNEKIWTQIKLSLIHI